MKNIKRLLLCFVLILCNMSNVFAEDLFTSCKVNSSQATTTRFRIETNGVQKYGYLYDMKVGNGQAFCLNAGKSNKTTYVRGAKLGNSGKDLMYRKIYQWYLNNKNTSGALKFAQIAIWVIEDGGTAKFTNYRNDDSIVNAVVQGKATSECSQFTQKLKDLTNNEAFSCNCFLQKPGSSGCTNSNLDFTSFGQKVYASTAYLTKGDIIHNGYTYIYSGITPIEREDEVKNLTVEKYVEWYVNLLYENGTAFDNMYGGYKTYITSIIMAMNNTDPYSGDLYYWEPSGGTEDFQRLIGIGGCGPGDQVSDCPTDLATLLSDRKYDTEDERKNSSSYMTELQKLKDDYPSRLNIDDPYNPRCENGGGGPNGPICDPQYNEYACSFSIDNGGFYIADTGSDTETSCWLGAGIAYNYGTDEVSSDTNLGNKYCAVRCWEAFGADFPGAIDNIKAGTFFFWGRGSSSDGYLGNLNAARYCQTVSIDYDAFRNDFNANEGDIQTAYDSYVAQKKYNAKSGYDSTEKCTLPGTCLEPGTIYGNSSSGSANYEDLGCTHQNGSNPCYQEGGIWYPHSTKTETTYCKTCQTGYNDNDKNGTCEKEGTKYKRNSVDYNGQQSTSKSKCMESNSSASDIDAALDDTTELSSRATTLQGLIDKREGLTHLIRSCQSQEFINKDNADLYTFKGEVKLKYTDPAGIDRNMDGAVLNRVDDISVSDSGVLKSATPESFTCRDTSEYTGAANYSGCFGNSTTPSQTFTLTSYSSYSWKYTGLFKYYYPANEYSWKAIVENAHVVNEKTYTADYSGMKIVPYKVGYGIPTAFSLIEGFYNISVDISGFGHNEHFDKVMQKEENVSVYNYACPYKVVNELYGSECNWDCNYDTRTCTLIAGSPAYCNREVNGIDLVYRLIEMPNDVNLATRRKIVFPSIDGDGRDPGANWEKFINEHTTGFTNVTSNNVVYDNNSTINTYGPIYEIELTPSAIGQIREDTLTYRNTDKDPYTSYTDANNHEKVICKGDHTERTCASNYITELIQSNIITGGYYLKCNSCRNNTNERLDWIDSQKERFY